MALYWPATTAIFIGLLLVILHEPCMGQGNNRRGPQYNQNQPQYGGGPQYGSGVQKNQNYNQQYSAAAVPQQIPPDRNKQDVKDKVEDIRRYMNLTQNPCVDFYDYACGKWLQFQNLTGVNEGDTLSVADQLERKVNQQLQRLLGTRGGSRSEMVVKSFYTSCTRATVYDQKVYIKNFVKNNGGLPELRDMAWQGNNYQWTKVITNLKRVFNIDILIVLTKSREETILEEPPKTILPADLCSSFAVQKMEMKDEIYNIKQMEIKNILKSWFEINDNTADRYAGDILKFEYELCKYMRKADMLYIPNVDGNGTYNSGPYNPLDMNRGNGRPLNMNPNLNQNRNRLNAPEENIDFANFVQASLGQRTNYRVRNEEYFQYLSSMVNTRKASLAYYIMYRALSELAIPLNQAPEERAFFCVRQAMQFFPSIVGNLYQTQFTYQPKPLILQDIVAIYEDIKEVLRESAAGMKTLEISEPQLQQMESPYANISTNGNYWQFLLAMQNGQQQLQQQQMPQQQQQQWQRQQFQRQQGNEAPNLVEAFATTVSSNDRMLQFGWGLLQPPFYSYNYPRSLKYSSVGYILARELMKSNDPVEGDDSKRLGAPMRGGNPRNSGILDGGGLPTYKECFRAQVSSYFYNTPDVYRNGTQLRDIIADVSAVNIAFAAYSKWLQKQNPLSKELEQETFRNIYLSNTQLFFVNYALSRCATQYKADTSAAEFFPLDRHTLERLNVNGPVSNGFEFGRDFNCAIGSEMNTDDKCSMFAEVKQRYT